MAKAIEIPQTFAYVGKVPAAKKIKNLLFRKDEPVVLYDAKIIRLVERLPYMKRVEGVKKAAAVKAQPAPPSGPKEIPEIPADWKKQHWKRRVAWAKAISGLEVTDTGEADAILAMHMGEDAPAAQEPPAPVAEPPQAEA